ncbi:MAG: NAD(+) synthase [Catonella sp.]
MRHGFVKVAAITPDIRVADCDFNGESIIKEMKYCADRGVKIAVFPELSITGYTCGELFLQERLLNSALNTLKKIIKASWGMDMLTFVGLPFETDGKLYNVAAVFKDGELLGMVPKQYIPNYSELYEARHFAPCTGENRLLDWEENKTGYVYFGNKLIFENKDMKNLKVAAEICEDLWVVIPPSNHHAMAGATVIANLSASPEIMGKQEYRRNLVQGQSARLNAGYIYATTGEGESTTDLVFGGHNLICEDGIILAEKKRFKNGTIITEIDVNKLAYERRKMNTCEIKGREDYNFIAFSFEKIYTTEYNSEGIKEKMLIEISLGRKFPKSPFIPGNKEESDSNSEDVITIQSLGLKKRMAHVGCKYVVIGLSGGLDSTLAVLVACRTMDMLGLSRENVIAVTMPCFGTTGRTYNNAIKLAKELGITLREINIKESVLSHLKDIGHDENNHNITFENAQARERTQVLMDIANEYGGLVIGTGDMSELALGFATYNGDHMSMYGVNASIPKTLVRQLVRYCAKKAGEEGKGVLEGILTDVVDTPVSPELLPTNEAGETVQKTEDIVGPYELNDFFLYNMVRWGMEPDKLYRLARIAFADEYSKEEIEKWQKSFYRRFFAQQYKRSCLPDGPKVGSVTLSPRGDFRMPSDAVGDLWQK